MKYRKKACRDQHKAPDKDNQAHYCNRGQQPNTARLVQQEGMLFHKQFLIQPVFWASRGDCLAAIFFSYSKINFDYHLWNKK
jgi:hypothetical protein